MREDNTPVISVIMGVYNQNDKEALAEAIHSILRQTFRDFEFIIYDDGSEKAPSDMLKGLSTDDERIVLYRSETNKGLAFSLNSCLSIARGKYIARMDADDMSMKRRLQAQVDFLEHNEEYAWCGCNAVLFDEKGAWGKRVMPETPEARDFLKYSPYIHPSVMYRREALQSEGGYRVSEETLRCEDYEVFMRLHAAGLRGYNIQDFLFRYREDRDNYKRRKFSYRIREAKVRYKNYKKLGVLFPIGWICVIRPIVGGIIPNGMIRRIKRLEAKKADAK